jgi:quercetin dioxygenase-like cupin family protein
MPFLDTRDIAAVERRPGWLGRTFHSEHMTFAQWRFTAGSTIHRHSHPQEEVWQVIEGELEVTVGDETQRAGPGMVAIVPGDTEHEVLAITDGFAVVVDHPRRD